MVVTNALDGFYLAVTLLITGKCPNYTKARAFSEAY